MTSLAVNSSEITLMQFRDLMAQLPNLDNLSLSGPLDAADRTQLPGIGAVVRGKFGGRLMFSRSGGYDGGDIVNMLLEIPSGLHFTEMEFDATCKGLPSAVRLAEVCAKTVVKLSYRVETYGKSHHLS